MFHENHMTTWKAQQFITHVPVHINDFRVCVQVKWNVQVKDQVTEM